MYLVRNIFYEFTPIWLRNIQLAIAETSAWEWYCREAGYYIRKRRQNHGNIFDKSWQYLWQNQYNLTKPWQNIQKELFQQFVFLCWWWSWIIKYQTFQGFWPPTKTRFVGHLEQIVAFFESTQKAFILYLVMK